MPKKTCPTCSVTFMQRRKDATYCSPRCKTTAKNRRKRSDPEKAQRELEAQRMVYHRRRAENVLGLTAVEGGFTAPPKPAAKRGRIPAAFEPIDYLDDPATWRHTEGAPRVSPEEYSEINFHWLVAGPSATPAGQRQTNAGHVGS